MQPILFLAALAMITAASGCDWQAIEHASIQIDIIPGGYRAIFGGGNCTIAAEGPEVLPALDTLLAHMWCDWSMREA
jgi:hypothetical protein